MSDAALDAFRAEARAWLAANYPTELKLANPPIDPDAEWGGRRFVGSSDPQCVWMRRMAERGWTAPQWPRAYGGGGLGLDHARVLAEEMAAGGYRAPLFSFGILMLGPALLEFASEAQKLEHLPKIVRGEIRWCQGYSEPGAGSDLAGLQTRCEDKGDHWLINGSKIWTSYADQADWCFCLVRTDFSVKHGGVSFVLIDMASPGVETRPIPLISGESPFCETFFTDVKIPKANLVGEPGAGWTIAKRLLQHERTNIAASFGAGGSVGGVAGDISEIARTYVGVDAAGRLADSDLRGRIARNMIDFRALALTLERQAAESHATGGPGAASSVIKVCAAAFAQERAELVVEAMGARGLAWGGQSALPDEIAAVRGNLRAKANSIEGGTTEINLNVIAKQMLGLPTP